MAAHPCLADLLDMVCSPIGVLAILLLVIVVGLITSAICDYRENRRRMRIRMGLCACCGYDLRATPDRCPECGTPCGTS